MNKKTVIKIKTIIVIISFIIFVILTTLYSDNENRLPITLMFAGVSVAYIANINN